MTFFRDARSALASDRDSPSKEPTRHLVVVNPTDVWPGDKTSILVSSLPDLSVRVHANLDDWLTSPDYSPDRVILLCFRNQSGSSLPDSVRLECELLRNLRSGQRYALVSDRDGALALSDLLRLGVHGFLSADLPERIFVQAIVLISQGRRFFAASCFMAENAKAGARPTG